MENKIKPLNKTLYAKKHLGFLMFLKKIVIQNEKKNCQIYNHPVYTCC